LSVLVDADPALTETVHVMRSFRVNNPAGKFFVNWLQAAKARQIVAAQHGYRGAAG
jgi:hypothetical protein